MPKEKLVRTREASTEETASMEERRQFTCCVYCGVPKWMHADMSAVATNPHEFVGAKP